MKKKKQAANGEELAKRLSNLSNGRDEMNLCEFPLATLSERNTGRNKMQFRMKDFDANSGQIVERTLTVQGDPEYGLPTEKDEEIYLGLLKYTSDYNGFSHPEVRFMRSVLFDLMGWPKSDWAYARLTKGMHRLVGVRLSYQNLWRDNGDKQWRDQGAFGILDSFEFRDSRSLGGHASYSEQSSKIRWGSVLFQSFDSGYLKRIDYGLTRDLSATARRLYRYLDKHFHPPRKSVITIDLARLAYQHIGISQGVALDKVRKRYIEPAVEELTIAGYLKESQRDLFLKMRRGVWNVTFELAGPKSTPNERQASSAEKLIRQLEKRGVSTATSLAIVAEHQSSAIVPVLQAMDEQLQKGVVIRSADNWVKKAIAEGFQPSAAMRQSALRPERQLFRNVNR